MARRDDTTRTELEAAVLRLEPNDDRAFRELETEIRGYQRTHNPVVRAFGDAGRHLPIAAFRLARVATFPEDRTETVFRSSGTVGPGRAIHYVRSRSFFDAVASAGFERTFGNRPGTIVGYLPHYATDSSLVAMMRRLVACFGHAGSAVFSGDPGRFLGTVSEAADAGRQVLVVGAAFGLLELAEHAGTRVEGDVRFIETGGMKTRRRSVSRQDLHDALARGFGVPRDRIGGEYGMCELTSQAWARTGWWYEPPPWMRVEVVDPSDPDRRVPDGAAGLLAVTDLANLHTASHVLTEDLGMAREGRFTVLGRAEGAALRGCNFLMEQER